MWSYDVSHVAGMLRRARAGTGSPTNNRPKTLVWWGAGCSVTAGIPACECIVKEVLRELRQSAPEDYQKLMIELPWLTQARIDNVPCDTPSVTEADEYDNEWQTNPNAQTEIVRGGIDLFAVSPTIPAGSTVTVTLSLIGNAPIPAADGDFIQVSRDVLDVIIDEAQHLAQFKHGGKEFADSIALHKNFIGAALLTNRRLRESGIFAETFRPPVNREAEAQPRFEEKMQ